MLSLYPRKGVRKNPSCMKKSIGLCIPAKDTSAPNLHTTGAVPQQMLDEFYSLLGRENLDYTTDLHPRDMVVRNGRVYHGEVCISDMDVFFWYYPMIPDREGYEMSILRTLATSTTVLPNPEGLYRGFDKFDSHTILTHAGVPTAEFALFRSDQLSEAKTLLKQWGSLLLKPSLGNLGRGIVRVESEQQLIDIIQYSSSALEKATPVFVEKFEPNDMERWISTTIIGNTIVYGYRKRPEKIVEGWKVYDEQGKGGCTDYVDPAPVAEMVMSAKEALGADIIGFDCIYSSEKNGYVIVDENTFPGMYEHCFEQAGKGSWAELFFSLLMDHVPK